jgi:hypothetical protein
MLLVGRRLKVAARRCVVPPCHGACACKPPGDGAVFGDLEMFASASRRVRAGAMPSRSCSSSCDGGDAAPVHRRGSVMSSNDGTRPTDAYESLLAHHFFPVSLNWLASRGRTFLGRMLLVNQANDHGEITGSGVADSVAHDAKDRIEVIVDWNSGVDIDVERLNSYRGRLGAYRRRAVASHGLLAPITMAETTAAKPAARRAGPRLSIGRLSDYALSTDLSGFRRCSRPLGAGLATPRRSQA